METLETTMMEDPYEEQESELTIMPPLFWVAIIFLACAMAYGCAAAPKPAEEVTQRICYVQLLGKTEEGYYLEAQVCQTPEAFAASHK
jgi:hypothetical protein